MSARELPAEALPRRMLEAAYIEAGRQGLIRNPESLGEERDNSARVQAVVQAALCAHEQLASDELLDRLAAAADFTLWSNPHDVGMWCVATGTKSSEHHWGDTAREALESALGGVPTDDKRLASGSER